jgi:hypothetical protein
VKWSVDVWEVANAKEAAMVYRTIDGFGNSVETGSDKLMGAFKWHDFLPKRNYMFRDTSMTSAVKYLLFEPHGETFHTLELEERLEPWMDVIRMMDGRLDPYSNHALFRAPFTAAQLCTLRAHGDIALEFWQGYHDNAGRKFSKTMCGVQRAREIFSEYQNVIAKTGDRARHIDDYAYKIIYCCDQWLAGRRFDLNVGKGKSHWRDAPAIQDWWQDNIGEFDWPELRVPVGEGDE